VVLSPQSPEEKFTLIPAAAANCNISAVPGGKVLFDDTLLL